MTVDIAKDRGKSLKKDKEKRKIRKSQTTAVLLLLFYIENSYFVRKHIWKNLVYIVTFALSFFHVEGYWKCSNTNAHIDIHWFCRRHTLIQNT